MLLGKGFFTKVALKQQSITEENMAGTVMMPLSEPEGDDSDCSSYEELSSASEGEELDETIEEEIILISDNNSSNSHRRKDSSTSTSSTTNYRSWTANRRRGSKPTNVLDLDESSESLALIDNRKGWWYWTKLALFMATPFIARQLGIFIGKRILSKTFNKT